MIEYTVKVNDYGDQKWYLNGKYHREDGPAIEFSNGSKEWWLNGERHRENGPAIEYGDGSKAWFLDNINYTEKEFNEKMNSVNKKKNCETCKHFCKRPLNYENFRYYENYEDINECSKCLLESKYNGRFTHWKEFKNEIV